MKLFGLIAVVLLAFSACQKENLRPDCPSQRTPQPAGVTTPEPEASAYGLSGKPGSTGTGGTGTSGSEDNNNNDGGGIVDPNTDQDASNSATKTPKKGR